MSFPPDDSPLSRPRVLLVGKEDAGARLDRFLTARLGISRKEAQRLLDAGAARVNGGLARKGKSLAASDRVEVRAWTERPAAPHAAGDLPAVPVLYEDARIVVVDKPAGVHCHPLRAGESGSVADLLLARHPEMARAGLAPREAGLVHRLDRDTSGVLLAARDPETFAHLRAQFEGRRVRKTYLALVAGRPPARGRIDAAILRRGRTSPRVYVAEADRPVRAREILPATTFFRRLEALGDVSLLEVRPVTGVMHQVRAHLASLGHPVLGDCIYGGAEHPVARLAPRHLLHAVRLAFVHPATGRRIEIESPLPEDFRRALVALRRGLR